MSANPFHILVVDDDDRLRDLLRKFLTENGFLVETACDAKDARLRMTHFAFDLIVLDLMMPGESGLDFAEDIRKSSAIPILMLTAMGETESRIAGFEKGADDYLSKPFEPRELLLRINAILRRIPQEPVFSPEVRMGDVLFDMERCELLRRGKRIHLTEAETTLLKALADPPGVVLSRDELSERTHAGSNVRSVDVQVTRLRRKIEENPKEPRYLQTVRARGYILRPD
jgi:two-component system, OmpR family, phosphate regulon response regulator OmpR